ncbi:hypothetical protein [Rhodohalobacter mucosus]|uniref:Uncharacterized protein n=1 Tax=Rhodohalobacter mucosus TaxID=2079485 RepID=A0A316U3I4_9BACT|nr:hypothetical protein [Rhodohalobacter mucosus]PWN08016.1 hypothetical protein DDZ15_03110 [Rhodohalobacter mucosus]
MMKPLKENFIHLIQLLASLEKQDRYQAEVDVDIYDEFICMWFDDFYSNEAREHIRPLLSSKERKYVDDFHEFFQTHESKLPTSYAELRESPAWKQVREKADETLRVLNWNTIKTKSNFGAV